MRPCAGGHLGEGRWTCRGQGSPGECAGRSGQFTARACVPGRLARAAGGHPSRAARCLKPPSKWMKSPFLLQGQRFNTETEAG